MKYNFIEHNIDEVLLIKNCKSGKKYNIQYNGRGCFQYSANGKIVGRFSSKYRYFNPRFWYNRAAWLDSTGWIGFFKNKKQRELFHKYADFNSPDEDNKKATMILLKDAVEASCVFSAILRYASKKLNVELKPEHQFYFFGENWWEALIPVTCNGKSGYVLTWTNCD